MRTMQHFCDVNDRSFVAYWGQCLWRTAYWVLRYWGQCANSFIFFHPAIYPASVLGSLFKRLFHSLVLNA